MIKEMTSDADILATFEVMSQLRPHLKRETYLETIHRMRDGYRYRLVARLEGGKVVGVGGFRINECLSYGRHLYLDDLVSDEAGRSKGYGKEIFDWLLGIAKSEGCGQLHLDSGVQRHGAHRFYLRERMDIVFYHFARKT
jgi:GNAT superfamily N-acetyltransferase